MTKKKTTKKFECKNKVCKNKNGPYEPKLTITVTAKSLTTFLDAVGTVVSEARVHVTDTGLKVFQVDGANVCMINTELKCKTESEDGAPKVFGIDIAHLRKLLMHSKGATVSLVVTVSGIEMSYSRFSGECCVVYTIDMRKDPDKEPDMTLNAHFDIPGKYLFETSQVFGKSGKILFETVGSVIYLSAECGDLTFREVVGTVTNPKMEQIRSLYSGDYIHGIAKFVKDAPIHIDVGIDHPIVISTEKDDCKIRYLLAPRIEGD